MPSRQKTLLFSTGFIASIGSFAIICTCLATTEWVSSDVYFKAKNHSGYASVKYGLFQGTHAKFVTDGPGLGIPQSSFQGLIFVIWIYLHELTQTIPTELLEDKEQSDTDVEVNSDNPDAGNEETEPQVTLVRKSTRSNKGIQAKRLSYLAHVALQPEPGSWDEMQRLPTKEKQKWIRAADEEMTSLSELNRWRLSELPQVAKPADDKGTILQELSGSAKVIHIIVILFLVLSLFCSFFSSATTCLNSVSNPYVTFLGPIGVYVWASVNGFFILLVMILCASNTEVIGMPKKLAIALDSRGDEFLESRNTYGYSFWILTLSILLNVATIIVIYFYQHTRYSRKKEQERPMENASKDVILF
ncbi:clarin-3 [Rhinophrynus dorsalis]